MSQQVGHRERLLQNRAADVEIGVHLCYGDFAGRHFVEPKSAARMVEFANALAQATTHKLAYIHMPVPIDRVDDAFYEPLRDLKLAPGTELYLGLVHAKDGMPGTRARVDMARRYAPPFGIATECGMARIADRGTDGPTLEQLLELHARVAAPVR